jgi:hypothetical protein
MNEAVTLSVNTCATPYVTADKTNSIPYIKSYM